MLGLAAGPISLHFNDPLTGIIAKSDWVSLVFVGKWESATNIYIFYVWSLWAIKWGRQSRRAEWNKREEGKRRAEGLTEELCGVSVARGFFVVGKPFIDDFAHSSIKTLQLLVLGCHWWCTYRERERESVCFKQRTAGDLHQQLALAHCMKNSALKNVRKNK